MKISTDTCIFGATVAKIFAAAEFGGCKANERYLDIGAGTGVLSLMLAQKTTACIDAVEIDGDAYKQCNENFEAAVFKNKLAVYNCDVMQFNRDKKYDGLICNPPFYTSSLRSPDDAINAAKHSTCLTLQQLLQAVNLHLNEQGIFAVLLPYPQLKTFIENAASVNLYLKEQIVLRHSLLHPYLRGMLFFCKSPASIKQSAIVIKNKDGSYTEDFIKLMKPYYLYL